MVARTTSDDTGQTTITISPSVWVLVLSLVATVIGATMWIQQQLSDRPIRTETQEMIDRSLVPTTQLLMRIDAKIDRALVRIEQYTDDQEKRNRR